MKMLMSDYEVTLVNDNSTLVLALYAILLLVSHRMLTEICRQCPLPHPVQLSRRVSCAKLTALQARVLRPLQGPRRE